MGVAGCGKSTIGKRLAEIFGCRLIEGDDYHSSKNIDKMKDGISLTDQDRSEWLQKLSEIIVEYYEKENIILTCSALKKTYRDILRVRDNLKFIYLKGDFETISKRLDKRREHFLNPSLLKSQFADLEEPSSEPDVITIDIDEHKSNDNMVKKIVDSLI